MRIERKSIRKTTPKTFPIESPLLLFAEIISINFSLRWKLCFFIFKLAIYREHSTPSLISQPHKTLTNIISVDLDIFGETSLLTGLMNHDRESTTFSLCEQRAKVAADSETEWNELNSSYTAINNAMISEERLIAHHFSTSMKICGQSGAGGGGGAALHSTHRKRVSEKRQKEKEKHQQTWKLQRVQTSVSAYLSFFLSTPFSSPSCFIRMECAEHNFSIKKIYFAVCM